MFTLREIVKATRGKLIHGDGSVKIRGVSINSRTVKKGDLFIAIKGKHFDGHRFINDAVQRGAIGVVVSKNRIRRCPSIHVKDTVKALGDIACAHRRRFNIPVIAITGSAGKTTTKDLTAAVLGSRFRVLKNAGTENNHIGVPLTLLKLKQIHSIVVVELGTNRSGDIRRLTDIVHPDVAIMTNIGESHLELLKSPGKVFQEKFALIKGMAKKGTVIFNADDPYLRTIPSFKTQHKLVAFRIEGKTPATAITIKDNHALQFHARGFPAIHLKTPAVANVYNALAAMSCGRLFHVSCKDIRKAIERFRFIDGRQAVRKADGCWLIDDTYNSNPVSLKSALHTLAFFKVTGRRILVCADMLELGSRSKNLHCSMGRLAAASGLDLILTYGKLSVGMSREVNLKDPNRPGVHCRTRTGLHKKLRAYCRPGDVILVKGSRGMRMEKTIAFLKENL